MKFLKSAIFVTAICLVFFAASASADQNLPGKGITVKPARATWNTGFFQEAIISMGMTELGYDCQKPKDLPNPIFYKSVVLGDIDYWTNGWFPLHNAQLPKDFDEKAEAIGYLAKSGGLQGYLVSKKAVDEFNIKSLDDFKRPEVIKAFDDNGDGKADLTACPPGWGCEKVITHHMDAYNLLDYIKPNTASYEAGMAAALGKFKSGKPIFFYTWAPNWTIFKLKPGKDVMWINVPEIKPSEAQKGSEDLMSTSGIVGAVSDPVDLGFVVNDIRIVANKKFLEKNPAAKKFFELFKLPLADINEQNTKMNEGEKSTADIKRHAEEWIKNNKATWDGWLSEARKAAM